MELDDVELGKDLCEGMSILEEDLFKAFAVMAWMGIGENGDEPEEE